jgi:ribonuclease HI
LRHDVLRIIYEGAILPIISYGAPIWIECLKRKHNVTKLRRVQRLINIKIARAYRTTSYEALCLLTGITPIQIELRNQAEVYHITRGSAQIDEPRHYRDWTHPAKAINLKEKCKERDYTIDVYTDGSKSPNGVGSGIAIFMNKYLMFQLRYKLAERCSNNQAEQLAILKALEKIKDLNHLQGNQRSAAIHTDSKITLDAIATPRNHQNLVEQIREEVRRLENDNWTIHFT